MGFTASDLADWWDTQHAEAEEIINDFVADHPGWFSIGLATTAATSMDLAAGFVDVLRLGKGVAEGGIGGVGHDMLRFVAVLGPAGRVAGVVSKGAVGVLSRVLIDVAPKSGICTWVNAAGALRRTGIMYASVDDLARLFPQFKNLGGGYSALPELWGSKLVTALRQLGAKVTASSASSMQDVIQAVTKAAGTNANNVVIFSIKWKIPGHGEVGHALYAFRDFLGRFRIADRSGKVVSTLKELESVYPNISSATFYAGDSLYIVYGAKLLVAQGSELATSALAATRMTGINSDNVDLDEMKQEYDEYKALKTNPNAWTTTFYKIHNVVGGDTLSEIALHYYKDAKLWPLIYEENKSVVGSNPHLIRVGQKLNIPELKKFTAEQIQDAKWRSANR